MTREDQISHVVSEIKKELLGLIAAGKVPATVPDFGAVGDYCDHNMLGVDESFESMPDETTGDKGGVLWYGMPCGPIDWDTATTVLHYAQSEVDLWIQDGNLYSMPHDRGEYCECEECS
jgi:hypothetical protein